jgi:2-polyprenyl-6-methoxyphenol hydroxylase-like FAD-dependent oxidoreductase
MPNPVLIVGAGPTGLTAALELTRLGISCRIIDRLSEPSNTSRALGVQPRTLELFEQRGLADEMVRRGACARGGNIYGDRKHLFRLDFSTIESRYNYILILPQSDTEAILTEALATHGVHVERGVELAAFAQDALSPDPDPVVAILRHVDGRLEEIRAPWLIGTDGAHSLVRASLDMPFEGRTFHSEYALGDMRVEGDLGQEEFHVFSSAYGLMALFPFGDGRFRMVAADPIRKPTAASAPDLEELQRTYDLRSHIPARFSEMSWSSSFRINSRMVKQMRVGRLFLGGDAAHIHSPAGAQGMNSGIQDMINLCWKLALVIRGQAAEALLDTYDLERIPVMRRVLSRTETLTSIANAKDPILRSLLDNFGPWIGGSHFVQENAPQQFSQLAIEYRNSPLSANHLRAGALRAGERVPDMTVRRHALGADAADECRLSPLLDPARFTLLVSRPLRVAAADVTPPVAIDLHGLLAPWAGAVAIVEIASNGTAARFAAAFGREEAYFLVRPDGYLALTADRNSVDQITRYLQQWLTPVPQTVMPAPVLLTA